MIFGGLEKFSLIDYPGELAAIIFTQGCNFQCPFCHNPMLVQASSEAGKVEDNQNPTEQEGHSRLSENDLLGFLEKRQGKLDGVVITGGEPTIHPDLGEFMDKIKKLGYKIKLDTNGTDPETLQDLIRRKRVDYIAMDFKGDPERYSEITKAELDFSKIPKSAIIIMNSDLPYEFRTTMAPGLVQKEDIKKIGENIKGAQKWCLQNFINHVPLLDNKMREFSPWSDKEMEEIKQIASQYVDNVEIR